MRRLLVLSVLCLVLIWPLKPPLLLFAVIVDGIMVVFNVVPNKESDKRFVGKRRFA